MSSYLSHAVVKPLVAGITAGALDHFLMKNTDLKSCAMLGGAVGAGIFSVSWVEPIVSPLFPTATPIGNIGKDLEGRMIEVILGSASAYAINRLVLKNEYSSRDLMYKVGIVAVADIVGETACEFFLIV